jgi:hypothetical protein
MKIPEEKLQKKAESNLIVGWFGSSNQDFRHKFPHNMRAQETADKLTNKTWNPSMYSKEGHSFCCPWD